MAKVDLLPCKEFNILLNDGTSVPGKFGLWSIKRFCDKRGLTLPQLNELMQVEHLTIDIMQDILLCAVEQWHRENKKEFIYTDVDCCNWIDELGGLMGDEFIRLTNHGKSEEKKSVTESQPSGKTSNVHIILPEGHPMNSGDQHLTKSA